MNKTKGKQLHLSGDKRWSESSDIIGDIFNGLAKTSGLTIEEVKKKAIYGNNGELDLSKTIFNCSPVKFIREHAKHNL